MSLLTRSESGPELDRRSVLLGVGVGMVALTLDSGAQAQEVSAGTAPVARDTRMYAPGWRSFGVGAAWLTVVLDGVRVSQGPHPMLGADQTTAAVGDVLDKALLPRDRTASFFNIAIVELGEQLIVVDTGFGKAGAQMGAGLLLERMAAAGYSPSDVDLVLFTHLHGDHIQGLMDGDMPVFPNAKLGVGRAEYAYFRSAEALAGRGADHAERVAKMIAPQEAILRLIDDGEEIVPGLMARAMFGHTPGMFAYRLHGGDGPGVLIAGDTFHHPVISFERPEWQVEYDMDHRTAAATRRRVAEELAETGDAVLGYHLPFPGVGFVARNGTGYRYVPETYQFAARVT